MARTMRRYAQTCLAEWAPRFGFGHYTILVTEDVAEKNTESEVWASVHFDVEEEWMQVYLDADLERLSREQVEHVVLHELTHGLLYFAKGGKVMVEIVCNRLASLLVGPQYGVRNTPVRAAEGAKKYFDDDEREAIIDVLPSLVVLLPEPERSTLLTLMYDQSTELNTVADEQRYTKAEAKVARKYGNARAGALKPGSPVAGQLRNPGQPVSLHELARRLGLEPSTIMRRRDSAFELIRQMFRDGA